MENLKEGERLDDLMIDGRKIIQNKNLYSFTSDSVLLADFCASTVKKSGVLIDLCSGSGIISLLLKINCNPKKVYQVEVQEELADMARRSAGLNGYDGAIEVLNMPLQGVNRVVGAESASVVVCNPPFMPVNAKSLESLNESERIAKFEISVTLSEVIFEAARLLKFGGSLFLCLPAVRLAAAMRELFKNNLQPKILQFVFEGKAPDARLVLIKATKGGREGIIIKKICK